MWNDFLLRGAAAASEGGKETLVSSFFPLRSRRSFHRPLAVSPMVAEVFFYNGNYTRSPARFPALGGEEEGELFPRKTSSSSSLFLPSSID